MKAIRSGVLASVLAFSTTLAMAQGSGAKTEGAAAPTAGGAPESKLVAPDISLALLKQAIAAKLEGYFSLETEGVMHGARSASA